MEPDELEALISADRGVQYARVLGYFMSTAWAVTPEIFAVMQEVLDLRAAGGHFTRDEIRARIEAAGPVARGVGQVRAGGVAVIPMHGIIAHRASLMSSSTGGTSIQGLRSKLREAVADPNVGAIVLDADTPGGSTDGLPEFATELRDARASKPIVGVANMMAGSAGYWVLSQCSEIVVSPSSSVGSIGVLGAHEDRSKMNEKRGVKTTLISAGKYKTEGSPFEALSDEARAALQAKVDEFYSMFVGDVARGRGVSADAVRAGFGEGRMVTAAQAVKAGMADRVGTLDETVARLRGPGTPTTVRVQANAPAPVISASSKRRLAGAFRA